MLAAAANATATPAPARHAGARMATVGVPFAPARTRRTVQVRERLERDSMVQIRHAFRAQTAGLARENDEDGLGDFLGQMRVAHLPASFLRNLSKKYGATRKMPNMTTYKFSDTEI